LLAIHIGDAGSYNGIQILDYRIRLTFEVGYMATTVQLLDTGTNCCLLEDIKQNCSKLEN